MYDRLVTRQKAKIAIKKWEPYPGTEVGNFYLTFRVIGNSPDTRSSLYFRSYKVANAPADDVIGDVHRGTHIHVPLLYTPGILAGEAVSGYGLDGQDGVREYGILNGIPNASPLGTVHTFSTNPSFFGNGGTETSADSLSIDTNDAAQLAVDPVGLPKIDDEFDHFVDDGVQVGVYETLSGRVYVPRVVDFCYDASVHFTVTSGSTTMRYRAVYFLNHLSPRVTGALHKQYVVGFGVSHDRPTALRGFGQFQQFPSANVTFEP